MLEMIAILAALAPRPGSGPGDEGGFFRRGDVDFWGTRRRVEAPPSEELWTDSSAPAPARKLLEEPTVENARAYVAWQKRRLDRLRSAMAALEEAKEKPPPAAPAILYFSRPGCSWCVLQEKELEGLSVVRVPEGSPLWEEHGVRATPTLVVNGRALRGFTPRAAIAKGLGRD